MSRKLRGWSVASRSMAGMDGSNTPAEGGPLSGEPNRWGTGGGKTVAIQDLDVVGAMIDRVEVEIPDGYPEGTRAARCSGCGEVRFESPDATDVDVWRKHFDHCGTDDVVG